MEFQNTFLILIGLHLAMKSITRVFGTQFDDRLKDYHEFLERARIISSSSLTTHRIAHISMQILQTHMRLRRFFSALESITFFLAVCILSIILLAIGEAELSRHSQLFTYIAAGYTCIVGFHVLILANGIFVNQWIRIYRQILMQRRDESVYSDIDDLVQTISNALPEESEDSRKESVDE